MCSRRHLGRRVGDRRGEIEGGAYEGARGLPPQFPLTKFAHPVQLRPDRLRRRVHRQTPDLRAEECVAEDIPGLERFFFS